MVTLLVALPRFFSGARHIRIDEVGIHLFYKHGRSDHYLWADPRTSFLLEDYSAYDLMIAERLAYGVTGRFLWNRRSLLTKDVYEAVLANVRNHSLSVSSYAGNSAWYWRSPLIHRIQGRRGERARLG